MCAPLNLQSTFKMKSEGSKTQGRLHPKALEYEVLGLVDQDMFMLAIIRGLEVGPSC